MTPRTEYADHYLEQYAFILQRRLETDDELHNPRTSLLYMAMQVRFAECADNGAVDEARQLLAASRRVRDNRVRRGT